MTQTMPTPTLRDLFALADEARAAALAAALESSPALTALAGGATAAAGPETWRSLVLGVAGAVPQLLEIDLGAILAAAWAQEAELGRYADAERHPAGEVVQVDLTTHVVTSEHNPTVEVLVGDQSYGELRLAVSVTLEVEGAALTISDGKIWQAAPRGCTASGRIECGGQVLSERPPTRTELPTPLVFPDPVPLVPGSAGWDETPLT